MAQLLTVPHPRPARVPVAARRRRGSRGRSWRWSWRSSRGRSRRTSRRRSGRGFTRAERTVLGWAGLRGAIPVVFATFPVIAGVGESTEHLQHRLLRGALSRPCSRDHDRARWRGGSGSRRASPALPRPLAETGTIRALGAEVVEYPVAPDDAAVGARVRDLGLPRDALVNVIVRRGPCPAAAGIDPDRGRRLASTSSSAEARRRAGGAARPLARGACRPAPQRGRPRLRGGLPVYTVRRWEAADGDPARPRAIAGVPVVEHLRFRHDVPGALVGARRRALRGRRPAARGRQRGPDPGARPQAPGLAGADAERAWWQEVIGALAA